MDRTPYNPGGVDTDAPTIRVRNLTNLQIGEVVTRLAVTAETDDLSDWGYLTGRVLHIIDSPEAIEAAITGPNADLRSSLEIVRNEARHEPDAVGLYRSMLSLVDKAERAALAHVAEAR